MKARPRVTGDHSALHNLEGPQTVPDAVRILHAKSGAPMTEAALASFGFCSTENPGARSARAIRRGAHLASLKQRGLNPCSIGEHLSDGAAIAIASRFSGRDRHGPVTQSLGERVTGRGRGGLRCRFTAGAPRENA